MIPVFPNFKKIEIYDKESIEAYTHKYQPYSDFNFTSLWGWDTNGERMVSSLNDNLVVRFTNYESDELFFSFFGVNKVEDTAKELIRFAKESGVSAVLSFIPEEFVADLKDPSLVIEEDRDNFDYIFSIPELVELKGIKFKEKRHSVSRFLRDYPEAVFEIKELSDENVCNQVASVLDRWENKKKSDKKTYDVRHEEIAINRLLQKARNYKLIFSCVSLNGDMIGFSIDEVLPFKYAISHFFKADNTHTGVYDFLNKKVSEYLIAQGVELWNWEQDLGVPNLRKSKMSYNPTNFLKKYKISLTSNE
jgi:hypothetical protein